MTRTLLQSTKSTKSKNPGVQTGRKILPCPTSKFLIQRYPLITEQQDRKQQINIKISIFFDGRTGKSQTNYNNKKPKCLSKQKELCMNEYLINQLIKNYYSIKKILFLFALIFVVPQKRQKRRFSVFFVRATVLKMLHIKFLLGVIKILQDIFSYSGKVFCACGREKSLIGFGGLLSNKG